MSDTRQRPDDGANDGGPGSTSIPAPANAPTDPAPGAELRLSAGVWLRAAGGAEAMGAHFGPVRGELAAAAEGVTAGTAGLNSPAELGAVQESWVRRFEAARRECGALAGNLRAVARAHGETNDAVRSSFHPVARRTHGVER
ncbi:hypothetical protein [Streptomyces sp. AC1-42W]|uniref:hypothetical protein n=1 Tax=Streptomyces sp. AC1-42W TaxID=2218666 RepID=UPI001F541797|nr:hypothetical protein [Streptomyces sp. AC1-42W]